MDDRRPGRRIAEPAHPLELGRLAAEVEERDRRREELEAERDGERAAEERAAGAVRLGPEAGGEPEACERREEDLREPAETPEIPRQPESGIGGAEHPVERAERGAERGLGEQRTERQQHERDHDGEAIERPATETTVPEPVPRADEREEDEARPGVERLGPPVRRPPAKQVRRGQLEVRIM